MKLDEIMNKYGEKEIRCILYIDPKFTDDDTGEYVYLLSGDILSSLLDQYAIDKFKFIFLIQEKSSKQYELYGFDGNEYSFISELDDNKHETVIKYKDKFIHTDEEINMYKIMKNI